MLGLLLGLAGLLKAQSPASLLARPVRVAATQQPLEEVLRTMSRQSGVSFSYSSTFVPLRRRITLHTRGAQPLSTVLPQLLRGQGVSYQVVSGQVVLWKTGEKPPFLAKSVDNSVDKPRVVHNSPPVSRKSGSSTARASTPARKPAGSQKQQAASVSRPKPAAAPVPVAAAALAVAAPPVPVATPAADSVAPPPQAAETAGARRSRLRERARQLASGIRQAARRTSRRASAALDTLAQRADSLTVCLARPVYASRPDTLPKLPPTLPPTAPPLRQRPAQFTLLPPLGTNGLQAGRTVNALSLNVVAGYAAGVRGGEVGGLVNVVRDTVQGGQVAGLVNLTGISVHGLEVAGLANLTGGAVKGVQVGGVMNVVRDDVRGVQVAGVLNLVGGAATARRHPTRPTWTRRALGLPRLLATDSAANTPGAASQASLPGPLLQAAGVLNLTGTDVRGLQTAPVLNVARRISGAQVGLVNVARHVRGVQIGLINIADSVDGVALGLINIVRHGYLHGEVWASEALPLNAALKLGVLRYYTILGVATQPFGTQFRWAGGFGIGTAGRPHGRFTYSLDLMQWGLGEPGSISTATEARLLTQLRPALAWQIEPNGRLQLVVAPTLNYALATRLSTGTGTPTWDFGANQWVLLTTRTAASLGRLWPGLNVGLRF